MNHPPRHDAVMLRWFFLILLVVAIIFAGVAGIIAIAQSGFENDQTLQRLVLTPLIILICGAIGLSGTVILQSGRLIIYMRTMLFLLLVTSVLGLILLWSPQLQRSSTAYLLSKLGGNLCLIVFSMLVIAQILILKTKSLIIRISAISLIVSQSASVTTVFIFTWTDVNDPYGDLASGILSLWIVLNFVGMLLLPSIVRGINKPKLQASETIKSKATLNLTCPECQTQQSLPTGLVRCSKCKFTMIIELEEPRCECGYQLYNLQSNKCPECGKEIPESERWAAESAPAIEE